MTFVPQSPSPTVEKHPVILFLNGKGENGEDGVRQISNNFGEPVWQRKRRFPFICVATQCTDEGGWTPESSDTRFALEMLDLVIDRHGGDPDRVVLTGPSSGGTGVLALGAAFPERFAAIVPLAAASSGGPMNAVVNSFRARGMPIWYHYNQRDNDGVVAFSVELQRRLINEGLSPIFSAYDDHGHDSWRSAYSNPALFQWMSEQVRSREASELSYSDLLASADQWPTWKDERWSRDDRVITFTAGEFAVDDDTVLLFPNKWADFEFHFEYWGPADVPCVAKVAADSEEFASVVIAHPELGRGGIRRGTHGEYAGRPDFVAQQTFKTNQWNDVRIRRTGEHVEVRLNGWLWCEARVPEIVDKDLQVALSGTCGNDQIQQWRYLRYREGPG